LIATEQYTMDASEAAATPESVSATATSAATPESVSATGATTEVDYVLPMTAPPEEAFQLHMPIPKLWELITGVRQFVKAPENESLSLEEARQLISAAYPDFARAVNTQRIFQMVTDKDRDNEDLNIAMFYQMKMADGTLTKDEGDYLFGKAMTDKYWSNIGGSR
jgi:hypothetical protein